MRLSSKLFVALFFFFAIATAFETVGDIEAAEATFLVKKHASPNHNEQTVPCQSCTLFCNTNYSANLKICASRNACMCFNMKDTDPCPAPLNGVAWDTCE
jgi:hypothetical protein